MRGAFLRVESFICRRGGHSIENQTVKRTSSYRFEVGEGSLISLIIKALGSTATRRRRRCSTLVHLSRASLGGGGGDSAATRRKACLRLEEEVAEACGDVLRGLCFRRGIRGGLRRRFEGFVFPERDQRGPAATF